MMNKKYLKTSSTGVKLYSNSMTGKYKGIDIYLAEFTDNDFYYIAVKHGEVIKESKQIEYIYCYIDFISLDIN